MVAALSKEMYAMDMMTVEITLMKRNAEKGVEETFRIPLIYFKLWPKIITETCGTAFV